MTYRSLTASTAIGAALLLASPAAAQFGGQLADPTQRPICADGAAPVCADGGQVLTLGEIMERGASGGDLGAAFAQLLGQSRGTAMCADGGDATCAAGAELILPGQPGYDAALAADVGATNDEARLRAEAEAAAAEAEAQAEAEAAAQIEARLRAEEEAAAAAAEAEAEALAQADAAAEAEAAAQADSAAAAAAAQEEARARAETAEIEARIRAEAEARAAAEAEADTAARPAPELPVAEAPVAEAPVAEAPVEQTEAEGTVDSLARALEQAQAGSAGLDAESGVQVDPQQNADDTARLVEQLTGLGRAADGDTAGGLLAALTRREDGAAQEGEAAVAETVETEVTAEDTRQSSEDFRTDPAGRLSAGTEPAAPQSRRSRDIERLALLGLGALAVGVILSNGDEVVSNSGDRVVVRRGGSEDFYVLRDDDVTLRQPGSRVRTERFDDGSSRTFVTRDDGTIIITVRDASGRVVLREREDTQGRRVTLIDDTETYAPVVVSTLPPPSRRQVTVIDSDAVAIRAALDRETAQGIDRSFSLRQIREVEQVRKLVPEIAVTPITFETASAAIRPTEAQSLAELGLLMVRLIDSDPREVFLIEGHTDAVGSAAYNLALSDRRAESVALALTEYFGVPPENMVVQGYGLSDLLIPTTAAEVRNRRVTVRRVSPLLSDRLARN